MRLLLVQPVDDGFRSVGKPVVACDAIGANLGEWVYMAQGGEATLPLPDRFNPSDMTIIAIIGSPIRGTVRFSRLPYQNSAAARALLIALAVCCSSMLAAWAQDATVPVPEPSAKALQYHHGKQLHLGLYQAGGILGPALLLFTGTLRSIAILRATPWKEVVLLTCRLLGKCLPSSSLS